MAVAAVDGTPIPAVPAEAPAGAGAVTGGSTTLDGLPRKEASKRTRCACEHSMWIYNTLLAAFQPSRTTRIWKNHRARESEQRREAKVRRPESWLLPLQTSEGD